MIACGVAGKTMVPVTVRLDCDVLAERAILPGALPWSAAQSL